MAGQYSHRQFFRRVPNHLLEAYFTTKNIALNCDFSAIEENKIEPIFQAFIQLSEDLQASIEADFQDINALAVDGGIQALVDEAAFYKDADFAEKIVTIEGLHAKAFWAFMTHRQYWYGATLFLHADNVSFSYWKKLKNLPCVPPHVKDGDIQSFAEAISHYFNTKQGRGRNCKVEPYRRYQKEYFFAYPEDYARSGVEWVQNTLETRARHPAFEIIFVYCQVEGTLDIYAPRNTKAVPELQKIFAEHILKITDLPVKKKDQRVYDLAPFQHSHWKFQIEPDSVVASIAVISLRLTLKYSQPPWAQAAKGSCPGAHPEYQSPKRTR